MKIVGLNQNNGANFTYEMTDEDLLWSLKMIYGESGGDLLDSVCVLWCMVNRFVLVKDVYKDKGFVTLIRNYSQPINPKWYRDGQFGLMYKGKDSATEAKFQRRETIRDMKEEDFPDNLRKLIKEWSNGNIPNPIPKAIDFAVPSAASKSQGTPGLIARGLEIVYDKRNRGSNCVDKFGNVFYSNSISSNWPANKVEIIGTDNPNIIAKDSDVKTVKNIIADIL